MPEPKDGGPAFPDKLQFSTAGCCANSDAVLSGGLSIRDWFAGQALAFYFVTETCQRELETAIREKKEELPDEDRRKLAREIMAHRCYQLADAMLTERERRHAD